MSISNSTTMNDLVGTIVSEEAQSAAIAARVMRGLVRATEMPLGAGSITIPRFQDIAVGSLTEGTAPGSVAWSTDGTILTPVERGVYAQISKRVLFADPFSDLAPYGEQLGRQLAEDEDTQILGLVSGAMGTTLTPGAGMDKATFLSGVAALETANAPGPYYGVFHPSAWADLRDSIGDAAVFGSVGRGIVEGIGESTNIQANGYAGSPYGIPCYVSSSVETGAAAGSYANIMASKQCLGYAFIQDLTVDVDENVTARAFDLMAWYAGHQDVLVSAYGVECVA